MPVRSFSLLGLLAALMALLSLGPVPAYSAGAGEHVVYLPAVLKEANVPKGQGIWGYVTENGARVSGVTVELWRYPGSGVSVDHLASAVTDEWGLYDFTGMPEAFTPAYYEVRYENDSNPNRLRRWKHPFSNYSAGANRQIDTFDIANIPLVGPADGATVTFPAKFQWAVRPNTPGDYYALYLFWPGVASYTLGSVGYHDAWTQSALPVNGQYGVEYQWRVEVAPSPSFLGIKGESFETRRVTFVQSVFTVLMVP